MTKTKTKIPAPAPKRYSVSRAGMGGRPANAKPLRITRVEADDEDMILINQLTPAERTEALHAAAHRKARRQAIPEAPIETSAD